MADADGRTAAPEVVSPCWAAITRPKRWLVT